MTGWSRHGSKNHGRGLHLVHGLVTGVLQGQVHHGVLEGATHVELQGDVVDTLQV